LVFLGSREEMSHLGYVQARCPKCSHQGLFSVYQARRKLTAFVVVAVPMSEQLVIECPSCGGRFGVPPQQADQLQQQMVSAERLAGISAGLRGGSRPYPTNRHGYRRTAYQVLQVDAEAEQEVIEAAFKRLALKYHPDKSTAPDAAARMRELIEAHNILTDARKKDAYDASIGIRRKPRMPKGMRAADV
jgi:DNA-directed RNA polymerase subunit RPC12/RpoP